MKDIVELIGFLNKTKLRVSGLLGLLIEPDSQMAVLYDAVLTRQVQTDEDAKDLLVVFKKDPGRLATVKYQLKERLLDAVFLLNFKEGGYQDRQKAFAECSKRWAAIQIMVNKNMRAIAIGQAEQLLRHTQHYEFTELSIDILRLLRLHYAFYSGDEKKYVQYETQLHEFEKIWLAESEVESLYTELVVRYVNSKSGKNAVSDQEKIVKQAEYLLATYNSFKIHLFGRLIEVAYYDGQNNFDRMEKTCLAALNFFETKEYKSGLSLELFYYNLITCHLYKKQYNEGLRMIEEFLPILNEGSYNWYKLKELHVYILFHAQHYQDAFGIYEALVKRPEWEERPKSLNEIWKIIEAYFYFFISIGEVKGEGAEKLQSQFRLGRFLNEVSTFSKDKKGMNISILIADTLCSALLDKHKSTSQDERVEAINKYRTRYLKDEETIRSNYFLSIIIQVILYGHDVGLFKAKSKKYLEKLEATPWEMIVQNHEVEIIPYQILYMLILKVLEHRK